MNLNLHMIAELALQVGSINGDILGRWGEARRAFRPRT